MGTVCLNDQSSSQRDQTICFVGKGPGLEGLDPKLQPNFSVTGNRIPTQSENAWQQLCYVRAGSGAVAR